MNIEFGTRLGVVSLALFCCASHVQAATVFSYTSSPQSWVGGGESVAVSPLGGFVFTATRNFDNGVSFSINDFNTNPNFQAARWWSLDFAAPFDATITAGAYPAATRWPFQDATAPGLSFSGNGRGNNMLTGSFVVLEAVYAPDNSVVSFAADFVQYDEGQLAAWNMGSIRFNSNAPIGAVPEPSTWLLLALAGLAAAAAMRRPVAVRVGGRLPYTRVP